MKEKKKNKAIKRRDFIENSARFSLLVGLGGLSGLLATDSKAEEWVWQIDPFECMQCGRCADECVLSPSAVKCVHTYEMCGYCKLCGGYHQPGARF